MNLSKWLILAAFMLAPFFMNAQAHLGTWKWQGQGPDGSTAWSSVTFKSDGTYDLDIGMNGTIEANGTYTMEGGVFTISDTSEPVCDGKPGTYTVKIEGNTLKGELVEDDCAARKEAMTQAMIKVE